MPLIAKREIITDGISGYLFWWTKTGPKQRLVQDDVYSYKIESKMKINVSGALRIFFEMVISW